MVDEIKKVFVALSGGLDSSTSAALLVKQGFNCQGIFMVTSEQARQTQSDAEQVSKKLGIKLHVLDLRKDFERIIDYFCSEYKQGRTPNPCVLCNRYIKFGKLWDFARQNGADFFATGHYAKIIRANKSVGLYEAADAAKDQSYALGMIKRDVLGHIIFPLADHSKNQTRELAAKFHLEIGRRQESQEICFIPDNDYVAMLEQRCPELARGGHIIDSSGKTIGQHNGTHRFTIGQRRGPAVAMGRPYYVVQIDAETNTITIGPKQELMHRKLSAKAVNWLIDKPHSAFRARVKIRYNDRGTPALVTPQDDRVVVEFDEDRLAITPGQLTVFYLEQEQGSKVAGAGWIDKAYD